MREMAICCVDTVGTRNVSCLFVIWLIDNDVNNKLLLLLMLLRKKSKKKETLFQISFFVVCYECYNCVCLYLYAVQVDVCDKHF